MQHYGNEIANLFIKLTETQTSIKILVDVEESLFGWMVNLHYYR